MTEKEEAIELVNKQMSSIYVNIKQNIAVSTVNAAKQCALICVDKILKTFIDIDPKLKYWKEVKEEINKL